MAPIRQLAYTFAILVAAPATGWASCPVPGGICQEYDGAAAVFVGDVVSIEPAAGPRRSGVATHVRFNVVEPLKGDGHAELTLAPSSEEFEYVVGQRVLVYARRSGNALSSACTRTRAVTLPDNEVNLLRALRERRRGAFITGDTATRELVLSRRLHGIRVTLLRGGTTIAEMSTDAHGMFNTPWLPSGTYTLVVNDTARGLSARRDVVISDTSRCVRVGSIVKESAAAQK